jgi:hypothetical protein
MGEMRFPVTVHVEKKSPLLIVFNKLQEVLPAKACRERAGVVPELIGWGFGLGIISSKELQAPR